MSTLAEFLQTLLEDGRAVLRTRPEMAAKDSDQALPLLQRVFLAHRAGIAGPEIAFDAATALAAAEVVWQACWFLLSRAETAAAVEQALRVPFAPVSAAQHLTADLLFRFLPRVYRRARAANPEDPLTQRLGQLLREWPLTGVLADVAEEPLTALDFDGHPGLLLLYAERLAHYPKPAWFPAGFGREYVELVWQEQGRALPIITLERGASRE